MLAGHRGTNLTTDEYMAQYRRAGTQKRSGNISVKDVAS